MSMLIRLMNWRTCIFCMAMQMTTVRRLGASIRKLSCSDNFQTINHLPPFIVDMSRLEHYSLFLRAGCSRPDTWSWASRPGPTEKNPGVSRRCRTAELHVEQMTVWRVLLEQLLYPCLLQCAVSYRPTFQNEMLVICSTAWRPILRLVSAVYRRGGLW
jgi:hypothetical protein